MTNLKQLAIGLILGSSAMAPQLQAKEINLKFHKKYCHGSHSIDLKKAILDKKPKFDFEGLTLDQVDMVAWSRNGHGKGRLYVGHKSTPRETIPGGEYSDFSKVSFFRPSRTSEGDWVIRLNGHVKVKTVTVHIRDFAKCSEEKIVHAAESVLHTAGRYRGEMEGLSTRERDLNKVRSDIVDVFKAARNLLAFAADEPECESLQREAWSVANPFYDLLDRISRVDNTLQELKDIEGKSDDDRKDIKTLKKVVNGFKKLNQDFQKLDRRM